MPAKTTIKNADSKGRIALGPAFANSTVILTEVDSTEIIVSKARAVPERELWLLEHPETLRSVLEGLKQAEGGESAENPPDFEADMKKARKALQRTGRKNAEGRQRAGA